MDNLSKLIISRKRQYIILISVLFLAYSRLGSSAWKGNMELHTIMETTATLLALAAGIMALTRYYTQKSNTTLFIGAGFLGTAFLDCYHCVVTSSFFAHLFPSALPSLSPWSWVASRLFLSICMFISYLFWLRENKLGEKGKIDELYAYTFIGIFTMISFLFFAFVPLPRAYYPELFFGRPEEFLPAFFFLCALIGYYKKGFWKTQELEHWIVMSLIVGFMSQAVFMSRSFEVFDLQFDTAHLLKKMSYIFVLIGLNISMFQIFKQAEDGKNTITHALERATIDKERAILAFKEKEKSEKKLMEAIKNIEMSKREVEKINAFMVGRELKMKQLKVLIKELKESSEPS